jgi:hypothetical protein
MRLDQLILNAYRDGASLREIANSLDLSVPTIHYHLRKNDFSPRSCSETRFLQASRLKGAKIFDSISSETAAYWLGFLCADGSLASNCSSVELLLRADDVEHVQKFADLFQVRLSLRPNGKNFAAVCKVHNCYLWQSLYSLGLRPRKSFKNNADVFDHIPPSLISHFVRGIFDGDGCLSFKRYSQGSRSYGYPCVNFCGCHDILVKIRETLVSNLGVNRISLYHYKNLLYGLYWPSKSSVSILKWMYKDASIYLERKHLKFQEVIECT